MRKSILNRMLELSDIKPNIKESKINLTNFDLVKNSVNGKTYAIVRENKKYYIKEAVTNNKLSEFDFDYIGGLYNKGKKYFNSFSDATKHLNLMFEEINNHYVDVNDVNLLESDSVLSEKKYVLKLNKPKKTKKDDFSFGDESEDTESEEGGDFNFDDAEIEDAEEGGDFNFDDAEIEDAEEGGDEDDEEGGDFNFDDAEEGGDEDTESEDEYLDDEIKDIQSITGKLGQKLRDVEDISSDMMKWVAKSVLSALDLDNMDSNDKEDVLKTIRSSNNNEDENVEDTDNEFNDEELGESYDSYMDDDNDPFDGMDKYFKQEESYDSYMDNKYEDNPNIGGDEDLDDDKLLFSGDVDNPNSFNSHKRDRMSNLAKKHAQRDITKHYTKKVAPNYDEEPSEKWAKHKLPYNTEFVFDLNEDNLNNEMETYEQERSYEELESIARSYGMDLGWSNKEIGDDAEESIIYLDLKHGNEKLLNVRINSNGSLEIGKMRGKNFIGQPIDNINDFIEVLGEKLTIKQLNDLGMYDHKMNQPKRTPKENPSEPTTKPGKPERRSPSERPSRRPFNPPPHIRPGEEPEPKAGRRSYMSEDDIYGNEPAPSKPAPSVDPDVKPGKPERRSPSERPSRRPFNPPPHIRPGEEPGPKAGRRNRMDYDSDVEFE